MGKRLGILVQCPLCRKTVDPFVVTKYDAVRQIPARTVVKCLDGCKAVWYIPENRIEERRADTS